MAEKVDMQEIADAASAIIERLGFAGFRFEGPARNILRLGSWEDWNTMVNELTREGYVLVTTAEYCSLYSLDGEKVDDRISREGALFSLLYVSGPLVHCVVPLHERELPEPVENAGRSEHSQLQH